MKDQQAIEIKEYSVAGRNDRGVKDWSLTIYSGIY
jgi:hypothetical protein